MLKKEIIVICFIFSFVSALSQNTVTDSSATCVAYWEKGDVKNIQVTKTSSTLSAGKQKSSSTSSYEATITVLDATDKGYILQWQCKPNKELEKYSFRDNVLNDLFLNLKVVYATDETGIFDSLINYAEMRKFVDATIAEIGKSVKGKEDSAKAIDMVRSIFATRESIEQLALKDISLFHSPYGVEYSLKNPQQVETKVPNFLGGEPFPAILTLGAKKIDSKNDRASIYIRQNLDKEKTAVIMNKVLDKTAATLNKPIKESDKLKEMELNDDAEFSLILSTGWLEKIQKKREVKSEDSGKIEITQITIQ